MSMVIDRRDPRAVVVVRAIQDGDVAALGQLLVAHPELSSAILAEDNGQGRSLLHVLTDWPGNFANGAAMVALLVSAGADVHGRFAGSHAETPLHWAASCDDVAVLDALLDHGADIEADGAVIAGGTALDDAVAFGQWKAARRLVERGARANLFNAAALGLLDVVRRQVGEGASDGDVTSAFWAACHGGQQPVATFLLDCGADRNWVAAWDGLTPLDAAGRSGFNELAEWLAGQGCVSAGSA